MEKRAVLDKPRRYLTIVPFVIIMFGALITARLDLRVEAPSARKEAPASFSLSWDDGLNLTQRDTTCGAHAAMAALYVTKGERVDPYEVYRSIPEKLGNGYIYPWGITRFLGSRGIKAKASYFGLRSDAGKERWLRETVSSGRPVIVVIGTRKYLHYVTVLGYDGPSFHLYDSLLNTDANGSLPGNLTVTAGELLDRWNGARFKGFRLMMAIAER